MVIKKINKTDEQALTKNNGKDVRYRIRKQQEREADALLKDFVRRDEGPCIQYPDYDQEIPD